MPDAELRARNAALVAQIATVEGDERAELVDRLILENLEVARSIARRYGGRTPFRPDLEQTAYMELVRAARQFDPGRGIEFLAYAIPCMAGAMRHYFRDSAWVIRPPRSVQDNHVRAGGLVAHIVDGVDVESYFHPRSLDLPYHGSMEPVGTTLIDEDDRSLERVEARLLLWPHLRQLSPRAQLILYRRFVEDCTQEEIAQEVGVTQYHVSRLLRRHLQELRDRLEAAA
ncbi:sigma-70 family RNA polymerase sigma factor [Nocardioides sp. YIM 152315]|uniref:sigma-70 family RNA polymerase sigma factor n=1 Tax=Nocardioides sp. YIM 152315 TaxID=3031760 RepID=UPI0023DBE1E6|nr:sigma-70 family RNA polymerase sigma factor [Nocardioides sp. YIM 152315]MDF1602022.1 sigma-70 family RNA polymerase sigma factor [Nocardioides sp. YIM 152315]